MRSGLSRFVRGAAGIALIASGLGITSALAVGAATSTTASAATTSGSYSCATPLGKKSVPASITTLNNTTPKTVVHGSHYAAKPKLTATIPASLINTAATATPSLTHLPVAAATLTVTKVNFSGTSLIHATKKATITTNVATVPINATTKAHGYAAAITYTSTTYTVTANSGKATLTPATLLLHVLVTLTCYPPNKVITYNTPTTVTKGYVVSGTNTLGVITTVNALPHHTPVTLTPPAGALPAGQAGVHYNAANFWTAVTGFGTNEWTETGTLDGLTFTHTNTHASLSGYPTAAGTVHIKVTVTTKTGHSTTKTYTLLVAAAAATPQILQPFKLTVTGGTLTMTCGNRTATHPTKHPGFPVETQTLAQTCTLITFGTQKLNEKNDLRTRPMNILYISTARGGPTDSWVLNAIMVPTKQSLTGNANCDTIQGFCNVTTTSPAKLATPHTRTNTTINATYFGLHGYTCKPNTTLTTLAQSQYYNVNPTPTTTPGRSPATTALHHGLSSTLTLCTAKPGVSGGEFIVQTGTYSLIVPPNVYAGTYYGTVQFTLVAT